MTVYLVGAGPGDPGLLTRKGAALLAQAEVVVYDRLVDPSLLLLAPPAALLIDAGKEPARPAPSGSAPAGSGSSGSGPSRGAPSGGAPSGGAPSGGAPSGGAPAPPGAARQEEINRLLIDHGRAGRVVVRLKGGDPFLFGRGGEEAEALRDAGVAWEVVPGVTSAFAVPAYAGVPVTHRGLSTSVTVVTGHVGDPSAPGGVDWEALGRAGGTLVVLMGMAARAEIAGCLLAAGRPASTPVVVVEWGTTAGQRTARTTLGELAAVGLGSPAVIVVGAVAGLDLSWEGERPLAGASVVVTRARQQAAPLSAALERAGARVLELPVIEIADPEDGGDAARRAVASLGRYRWVVFSSANAVHRFVPLARDGRAFAGARLAAVGAATAAALAGYHLAADLVPERASGVGLAGAFPDAPAPGPAAPGAPSDATGATRVLFPCAADARPTVAAGLRANGWEVDPVVVYRTVEASPPPDAALAGLAAAVAVTFGSPSAVRAYVGLRTTSGAPLPVPPVVACIGPSTAAAARHAGLEVTVEATGASVEGLVDALVAHRALRPPSEPPASSP